MSVLALAAPQVAAEPPPSCAPEVPAASTHDAALDDQPRVQIWRDVELGSDQQCAGDLAGRFELVMALTGRFEFSGSVEDLAARFGAISATRGLRYWSVTGARWRELIVDAAAVDDSVGESRRADFSAAEVLSGETLYFAQDDSRSTGRNVYAMRVIDRSPDRLVVEIRNLTRIRLFVRTLFAPESLYVIHSLRRLGPSAWGYYGLSAVRQGAPEKHERSFINRAAAFYRFLAGRASDEAPPLAP